MRLLLALHYRWYFPGQTNLALNKPVVAYHWQVRFSLYFIPSSSIDENNIQCCNLQNFKFRKFWNITKVPIMYVCVVLLYNLLKVEIHFRDIFSLLLH